MELQILSIPKTIELDGGEYLYGTEWLLTVTGTDNLNEMIHWCREYYGDIIIKYCRREADTWIDLSSIKITPFVNNIRNHRTDRISIRFKDDTDMMAFKLRWME